jgi:RND family efflux transporter MFP subunit
VCDSGNTPSCSLGVQLIALQSGKGIEAAMQNAKHPAERSAKLHFRASVAFVAFAFATLVYAGVRSRIVADTNLRRATEEAAVATVNVTNPQQRTPNDEIVLPGNTQAFMDAPIYARTNGYLKAWYADIGKRVHKGQILGEIDTPELDQQLEQARADLAVAKAKLQIAEITANRFQSLRNTDAVSQQEADQSLSDFNAMKATVDSDVANVRRFEQLQSFEKIRAPFGGVITARSTDVGTLIDAGTGIGPRELFHLAAIDTLRVYVAVPEIDTSIVRLGTSTRVTLDEYPNQEFHGTLVHSSHAIDTTSRTLLVEVDVDNRSGQILPGAFVLVHLNSPDKPHSLMIPSNVLLFRKEGPQVGVVRNGKVALVSVKIGRDYGNAVEIISGLSPADQVILDPSDSLANGNPVRLNTERTKASDK